jgi:3-phenylpropionate/trans-cinnamate dioxygenase ferredoxin reductase subunit
MGIGQRAASVFREGGQQVSHVVVAGAGHAGGALVAYLRQYGFDGNVTLVGEEDALPYQRPPLSKGWLLGEVQLDDLLLRPADFYEKNGIALRLGHRITTIDRGERWVHLDTGENLRYDNLVIATGCSPARPPIPGADAAGVMMLRSVYDAERLRADIGPGSTLVIVGGGYIGLEVAASARSLGANVIVVECASRVLARVAHPAISSFLTDIHLRHGVQIETGRCVTRIDASSGHVHRVELDDGRLIPCDAVLIGVGGRPNDGIARAAGITCDDGIVVDLQARSSDPYVFAIGDVTRRPLPLYDRMARLESVPNAIEQAKQAASAITGRQAPAPEVPWQWSDQYDLKIQIAGYPFGADDVVMRAHPDTQTLALFHMKGDRLLSVETVNAHAEFMAGRQLIGRQARLDKVKLADLSLTMKQLMVP